MGIQIVAMVWVFNSAFGLVKSALVGAAMSVSSWILALFGLLPYFGQKLYGQIAPDVIDGVFGFLGVEPSTELKVPGTVNFVLKWFAGESEMVGSIGDYVYANGHALSIGISIAVGVFVVVLVFRLLAGGSSR
jgi:hypothetical protein